MYWDNRMPTTIYDSSQITQRRKNITESGSFLRRIQGDNPTSGYAPLLGVYDQSIINTVKLGNIKDYRKGNGVVCVSNGCPCSAS